MVNISYDDVFVKQLQKITNVSFKQRIKKQVERIILTPTVGKPMRYGRKGEREIYLKPFRLAYSYYNNTITILEIYHKDEQ